MILLFFHTFSPRIISIWRNWLDLDSWIKNKSELAIWVNYGSNALCNTGLIDGIPTGKSPKLEPDLSAENRKTAHPSPPFNSTHA